MPENKNALAELAEELGVIHDVANRGCTHETKIAKVVRKAQRIVAELAKANPDRWPMCVQAIIDCRAIAEEGTGDGIKSS